ncbi:Asp-tRNA(Asn)/Glu-tRNA(Gln) amidotransferase subunit GatC [Thiopseudomonas acetoxidans]|uniref:Aspartyl/glutamyl-tRNA(Asn/Gln) amidotransferase subunit C n=1 Tax=Thiopseudomonas acetoxidans TaxID=3041622 RepID=A0ABT7SM05_9GAMM|nr:Asp-tRNA(Asn)/Glu-tRNA(Gln) amidotransferase subunit GatC [Thiopseudomonas sp. CY1220]MDM7857225.1 Asp-tRNA(Asn)/Glu-tRNA(Gln) amidotransferase subunit GatC [Thiopseudomonas sp. CY1220]NLC08462.1 Asp-tRNA(Asn)/Glu-tRNA(Gln) amidotransferase subunit GatC [Gammaproteobacteria bacterium]
MLTHQDVEKLAKLTQLALSDTALAEHLRALNQTTSLFSSIKNIATANSEPLISPLEISQRLRADVVSETNQRDRYQTLAPAVENGLYLVPKVLD